MKKPNLHRYELATRRQTLQTRLDFRARGSRKVRLLRIAAIRSLEKLGTLMVVPAQLKYYAPREFRRTVEAFFEQVDALLNRGRRVTLDFSKVERLFPCGVLILMGWVDEWVRKHSSLISAIYPRNEVVEQMLQHVSVLKKLGLPERREVLHDDVRRWHYFHGRDADATPIEPFMVDLQKMLGEEQQLGLGNCVTEAMINVGHHAYGANGGGPWWIFATVSLRKVFVALYDRGASVPATLLDKPSILAALTAKMWALGRGDGQLITAAVGGRTRTELPYRGKGLPEMLEFTKTFPNSELGIFSRGGFFRFDGNESSGKLKTPIKGTLVIWMLEIAEAGND